MGEFINEHWLTVAFWGAVVGAGGVAVWLLVRFVSFLFRLGGV